MKVLVTLNIPDAGIHLMREAGLEVTVWKNKPMTPQQLMDNALRHQALLSTSMDTIDKDFLQHCSHLKIISQFGAGYDNIDTGEAARLGIPVGNTPNAMSDATADMAFALMLAVSRKMCYMHKSIIAGKWGPFEPQAHLGMELKGKTLGIFGLGRIGLEMAVRCRGAYGMKVIYCNRTPNELAEQRVGALRVSFQELLNLSDVLSVHCSLNEQTRGLFSAQAFKKMRSSAIFINTSRGAVHQQDQLCAALLEGEIWGAGLDVTDPEPMDADDPLLQMENVVITPHIGSATIEAREAMSRLAAKNIIQCHRGEEIENRVN